MDAKTQYRTDVLSTLNPDCSDVLLNAVLGLVGEAGEFSELLKKARFHGHVYDREKAIKELGDVRYYLELAAYALDISTEEVEARNITKLKVRYPSGFTTNQSANKPND
jgi:NTP pyrophosphatase (non-canonical NTP hydrolase)